MRHWLLPDSELSKAVICGRQVCVYSGASRVVLIRTKSDPVWSAGDPVPWLYVGLNGPTPTDHSAMEANDSAESSCLGPH